VVFQVPKKLRAAQANHAAHALSGSYCGANIRQPFNLVRVEQLLVRLSQQHTCNLPADVAAIVQARGKPLRPEWRHAVRSVSYQSNFAMEHPLRGDAAVERILNLMRVSNTEEK
jgi:hypothetical protein